MSERAGCFSPHRYPSGSADAIVMASVGLYASSRCEWSVATTWHPLAAHLLHRSAPDQPRSLLVYNHVTDAAVCLEICSLSRFVPVFFTGVATSRRQTKEACRKGLPRFCPWRCPLSLTACSQPHTNFPRARQGPPVTHPCGEVSGQLLTL